MVNAETMHRAAAIALLTSLAQGVPALARADEGMWPLNMAPIDSVKDRWGFKMRQGWLQHAMKASIRINGSGSGSFVSPFGLALTNHHVAADCIQELSTRPGSPDLMKDGFLAARRDREARCPGLELNVLVKIDDVTEELKAKLDSLGPKIGDTERNRELKAEMARIEKACAETSGLRCDVVTLYAGGTYHLYQFEKYTDVRLVFAAESAIASYGGDADNFNYPRYAFDVAILRVYDQDKPLNTPDHFRVSRAGAQDQELVFTVGSPGATDRFAVLAKLEHLRDVSYPFLIELAKAKRDRMRDFACKGEAQAKAAREELSSIDNVIKALEGFRRGLVDTKLYGEAVAREKKLLDAVKKLADAKQKKRILDAWPKLEAAYKTRSKLWKEYSLLEGYFAPGGRLARIARHLVRLADERPKSSDLRLREYRDSNLASVEVELFSEAPVDVELEIERLAFTLEAMRVTLGDKHPAVKKALAGATSRARAEEAIRGTKLADVAVRKQLAGDRAAFEAARDPLLELIAKLDPDARAVRKKYEDGVESVERQWGGLVAEAYAAAFGASVYPDATGTPRINAGQVRGYSDGGADYAWSTELAGLFTRAETTGGKEPYALPRRWSDARPRLDLKVPFNVVSTNDVISGNSGSPMFNKNSELVGLVFDINGAQLANRFVYRDESARTISLSSAAILHVLEQVYGAAELVRELAP
jgi:hypothetical protein